jgi:hypothetical protein
MRHGGREIHSDAVHYNVPNGRLCAFNTTGEENSRRASDVRSARLNRSGSDGAVRPRDAEDCYGVTNHEPIEHFRSDSLPQDECRAISGINTFNRTDYKQLRATSANPCRARSSCRGQNGRDNG